MLTLSPCMQPCSSYQYPALINTIHASVIGLIAKQTYKIGEKVLIGLLITQQALQLSVRSVFQDTFSFIGIIKRPTEMTGCYLATNITKKAS